MGVLLPLLLLVLAAASLHGQGCAQCADATAATPAATQTAYRHAILLLIGAAVTVFVAGVVLLRKNP